MDDTGQSVTCEAFCSQPVSSLSSSTLISGKHKSISGRSTVSHLPFYSFPLSVHLKRLIVSLNMAMLGLKKNITFSEKTLIGWRRVKKLNRLYLFHMSGVKA